MSWVRNGWIGRVLAAMLVASMLPTLVVPPARAAGGSQFGSYERWIRAQIRVSSDVVEKAIAEAVAERTNSLQDFVAAFLESYEAAAPERSIAHVFTDRELSNEALMSYLQRRYTGIVDDAVLSRVYLAKAAHVASSGAQAAGTTGAFTKVGVTPILSAGPALSQHFEHIIISIRKRSSARPLGP